MNEYKSIWLFRFISYTYCQGTKDRSSDIRLLRFSLPCGYEEAKSHLFKCLNNENIEFVTHSIEVLSYEITNS